MSISSKWKGKYFVLVENYSKWINDESMPNTTSTKTIEVLRSWFAIYGFPEDKVQRQRVMYQKVSSQLQQAVRKPYGVLSFIARGLEYRNRKVLLQLYKLLAIVILSRGKCGLSTCTTRYLVAMATADLLVIIMKVILYRIRLYYIPECFLDITPVCSIINVLNNTSTNCSVWFTVTFTFDRFVAICCQKLKTKYCTEKTAAVVLATTCILLCSKNIPIYFKYEPRKIIDNVPWRCSIKRSYYTEPGWVGFRKFDKVLTPVIPFALILLLNALTVRHILVTSRVRKGLRGQSKGENHSDPEMESRRKSVILLFTISGNFILLWLIYVLYYFGIAYHFDSDSNYTFKEVGWMLSILSCCTNTFIYVVTQSKFREQGKVMEVDVKVLRNQLNTSQV
ncbi:probable G-protein coupled receptor 139 [Heterodontus francisci]|uniref:probable G-protein coupled receptor 139 n=1 Tax=Heterodontus francisci TaxID=7792 RepID=UPI00355B9500